jgi:hypothetical protein
MPSPKRTPLVFLYPSTGGTPSPLPPLAFQQPTFSQNWHVFSLDPCWQAQLLPSFDPLPWAPVAALSAFPPCALIKCCWLALHQQSNRLYPSRLNGHRLSSLSLQRGRSHAMFTCDNRWAPAWRSRDRDSRVRDMSCAERWRYISLASGLQRGAKRRGGQLILRDRELVFLRSGLRRIPGCVCSPAVLHQLIGAAGTRVCLLQLSFRQWLPPPRHP